MGRAIRMIYEYSGMALIRLSSALAQSSSQLVSSHSRAACITARIHSALAVLRRAGIILRREWRNAKIISLSTASVIVARLLSRCGTT